MIISHARTGRTGTWAARIKKIENPNGGAFKSFFFKQTKSTDFKKVVNRFIKKKRGGWFK